MLPKVLVLIAFDLQIKRVFLEVGDNIFLRDITHSIQRKVDPTS
jgi:hypothetical protein